MTQRTYQTTLLIRGDARNAVRQVSLTRDELEKLTGTQGRNTTTTQRMGQAFLRANTNVGRLTRGLQGFGGLLGAIGITAFARQTLQSADSLANMRGQLRLVTDSQEELNAVYSRALAISNETGQATESTISLYARLARSTEELDLTQQDLFRITNAVNQSFVVSGASTQEANSAVLQLSQGLAAGALRGEELNSVMENSPRLARALADGLGVSIGQLRQLGSDGELTAERVTTALLASAEGIEAEFAEMPITIGRSMQALSNSVNDALGDVDTTELTSAISEAQKIIADPEFKAAIGSLSAGMVSLTTTTAKALVELAKFSEFLGEEVARRLNGIAADDIPALEAEIVRLEGKLNSGLGTWGRTADRVEDLVKQLDAAKLRLRDARERQQELSEATRVAAEAQAAAAIEAEKLAEAQQAAAEEARRLAEEQEAVASLGFAAAKTLNTMADSTDAVREKSSQAAAAVKKLGENADPAAAAIERGAERMDDAFAQFFTDMLRDGRLSFDGLKDLALNTLGEVIYAYARNRILLNVGAAGGIGGAISSAAASTGSVLSGGIPGVIGALGGGVTNLLQGAAGLSSNLGFGAGARFFTGLENNFAIAGGGNVGLGSLATAGAGLAGGLLGNAVFGSTSGIGSTIGGIAGSFLPVPILGSALGSFIGSGIESLFGDSKPDFASAFQTLNFDTGGALDRELAGTGNTEELAQGLDSLSQQLSAFGAAVGAEGLLRVGLNNRGRLFVADREFSTDDQDGFLEAAFDQILSQTRLPASLRSLIDQFEGTSQEVLTFALSVVSLSEAVQRNPVDEAVRAYEDLNSGQNTATAQFFRQAEALQGLIDDYDGSAQAAQNLSIALNTNQQAAFQLTTMILDASAQMNTLTSDSAKFIRQSVLGEEELREARENEAQAILDSLGTLLDPQEIRTALSEYERLNTQIFRSLDDATSETAEVYAARIESANAIGQAQLEQARRNVREEAESANFQIGQLLEDGAQSLNDAAARMAASTEQFGQWVQALITQGIRVTAPGSSEGGL